jgi:predicted alpha/beta-fold hydrolase
MFSVLDPFESAILKAGFVLLICSLITAYLTRPCEVLYDK